MPTQMQCSLQMVLEAADQLLQQQRPTKATAPASCGVQASAPCVESAAGVPSGRALPCYSSSNLCCSFCRLAFLAAQDTSLLAPGHAGHANNTLKAKCPSSSDDDQQCLTLDLLQGWCFKGTVSCN